MNLLKNSKNIHAQGWIEAVYICLEKNTSGCPWKSDDYLRNVIFTFPIGAQQNGLGWNEYLPDTKKNNRVGWSNFFDNHCSAKKDKGWYFLW